MKNFKAALHLHVKGDPEENIKHTAKEAVLQAKELGFEVIAITCHNKVVYPEGIKEFGEKHDVTVIPGIEATVEKKHVIILNTKEEANNVTTFAKLKKYKEKHSECFIMAPHPFHYTRECLGRKLKEHIDLFDGIEWNYFYSLSINPNLKARELAKKYNKPLIGTSDIHTLKYFDPTYCVIKAKSRTIPDLIEALKNNQIELITKSFSNFRLIHILWELFKAVR